jgi:hypothetical protein
METDFSALASRIAASSDVLGCLILSQDGIVLGSFPPVDDNRTKPAWLRFAALGAPSRGFIQMSGEELWAYASVGPYSAFAVATGQTKPGVLLDYLEQALLVAAEQRDRREVLQTPTQVDLPDAQRQTTERTPASSAPWMAPGDPVRAGAGAARSAGPAEMQATSQGQTPEQLELDPNAEVDPVALSREFAGLVQDEWLNVENSLENL